MNWEDRVTALLKIQLENVIMITTKQIRLNTFFICVPFASRGARLLWILLKDYSTPSVNFLEKREELKLRHNEPHGAKLGFSQPLEEGSMIGARVEIGIKKPHS